MISKAKLVVLLAGVVLTALAVRAQMVSPAIDAGGGPFSYNSQPTDMIGVMDGPSGTEITPEGFLYTGFGELMFFTGNPEAAIHQRVKTLLRGYLPVVQYGFVREGIRYEFTCFAATLDGRPSGTLVDFVRVKVTNTTGEPRVAWLSSGMRYEGTVNRTDGKPNNRFERPAVAKIMGDYSQPGVVFSPQWAYSASGQAIERDGQVLYDFPQNAAHTVRYTLEDPNDTTAGTLAAKVLPVTPTSPVGIVRYELTLRPGQEVALDWKLPVIPPQAGSAAAAQIASARFDAYLGRTVDFWEHMLGQGMELSVPEEKVNDTFRANLIFDLMAREKLGKDYIQTVNDFQYHAFWIRDASFILRMYDLTGYPEVTRQALGFYPRWQQADGNFVSQGGQFDGVGQVLWIYGQHYAITHDRAFAQQVFPAVEKAVAWIEQARASDPLHLMPATRPGDNEEVTGHLTGHNFWALNGLRNAILLAKATGHPQEAARFQQEYDDYHATLMQVLDRVTSGTGGYIPPGLDGRHGYDWGNMLAVYPGPVLQANNPMVKATLEATRAKYKEGIMTYLDGAWLHDYLGFSNMETELILGDQQLVIQDLYAELVHTSSTQEGFETNVNAWGDRNTHHNLAPHGWFAARVRIVLRNMLVREQGKDLHLLSAISPEWVQAGSTIRAERVPTNFGTVNLALRMVSADRAELTLENSWVEAPAHIVLHLPWFMETQKVTADGVEVPVIGAAVTLPAGTRTVEIAWRRRAGIPNLSYAAAVDQFKKEYAAHYAEFLRTGK